MKSEENINKITFILLGNKSGKENGGLQFIYGSHGDIAEKVTTEESKELTGEL